jgi:hypothetical protein
MPVAGRTRGFVFFFKKGSLCLPLFYGGAARCAAEFTPCHNIIKLKGEIPCHDAFRPLVWAESSDAARQGAGGPADDLPATGTVTG